MPVLRVEYAKSARAKCSLTGCGKKIDKHEVRIGTQVLLPNMDEDAESFKWRHLCCFTERQLQNAKASGDLDKMQGYTDLAAADQKLVDQMKEGKLVGDPSILGRVGDVMHSPIAAELLGKGKGKAAAAKKGGEERNGEESPSKPAKPGAKRGRKVGKAGAEKGDGASDVDSQATDQYEVDVRLSSNKPTCPYGTSCFRTNPEHFLEYDHSGSQGPSDAKGHGADGGPQQRKVAIISGKKHAR
ncbi:hypothetical protein STCU_01265 [Strigomonas culicis]|uniref:PARP-type domain-containing protein n=1 Tax=Strigomonas culicis TaxID=28005 RepID=S9WH25_9TRYP|nr:hypothetical protein STCU_01265 [Strigomonas culicis]|eukprot:EPY35070.1 hypothetical protein STCU_01265 [Strigomonas culicis]